MTTDSLGARIFWRMTLLFALLALAENAIAFQIAAAPWYCRLAIQGVMFTFTAALAFLILTSELRPLLRMKDYIAERKPTQLEPIRFEDLHSELRPIADALNQCAARLRLDVTRRREFIADAAHQLRTPLALLELQVQCAFRCEHDDPEIREAIAGIRCTGRKMTGIVNQLLLLAQADETIPPAARAAVDMKGIVTTAIEELATAAQHRNVDLGAELAGELFVSGSANLLMALVKNVIENAIRHIQEGGRVTASCRLDAKEVIFEVEDNGPGIAAEERPRVFDLFYRGRSSAEGTGLGLAIVRRVAEAHGGSVTLASGPERVGLQVTVRLPGWPTDMAMGA
ncbi:HAMP domain-containing histidine kinase [Trinickia sp. LjRoot230]|uniref:sensor histidine kinase n=1 Tax=Trinickia sp. LjRoot230 TaxID=3342288 RepID=UPI003ED148FF